MDEETVISEKVDEEIRIEDRPEEIITLGPDKVETNHYFELKRDGDGQMVAQCTKCPLGYPIGIEEVKNGHVYIHGEKVI